jgi:hypothetical protein
MMYGVFSLPDPLQTSIDPKQGSFGGSRTYINSKQQLLSQSGFSHNRYSEYLIEKYS